MHKQRLLARLFGLDAGDRKVSHRLPSSARKIATRDSKWPKCSIANIGENDGGGLELALQLPTEEVGDYGSTASVGDDPEVGVGGTLRHFCQQVRWCSTGGAEIQLSRIGLSIGD